MHARLQTRGPMKKWNNSYLMRSNVPGLSVSEEVTCIYYTALPKTSTKENKQVRERMHLWWKSWRPRVVKVLGRSETYTLDGLPRYEAQDTRPFIPVRGCRRRGRRGREGRWGVDRKQHRVRVVNDIGRLKILNWIFKRQPRLKFFLRWLEQYSISVYKAHDYT